MEGRAGIIGDFFNGIDPVQTSAPFGRQQRPLRFRTIQVRPKDRLTLVPAGWGCGKPPAGGICWLVS